MSVVECDVPSGSMLSRELIERAYFRDSYRAPAVSVERNNEKKIEFSGQVVDRADGGDGYARSVAVGHFQNR